jgi:hypothetical protein
MRRKLHRKPFRHRHHGEFAGHIRADTKTGIQPGHRRGVDDMSALTMSAHLREEGF